MKVKTILLALAVLACATAVRATDKNPADYPIKFVVLETHTDTNLRWGTVTANGRGRINDGGQVNGVEFQYQCDEKLGASFGGEFFAAKWKKPGEQLTVLSKAMGSDHMNTCDVTVSVHDFIYVTRNGHLATESQQEWAARHSGGKDHAEGDDAPPPPPQP